MLRPSIMRARLLAIATVALACKSTAPYAVQAAAINTALAIGVSAQRRAEGDCYATCAHGTACNPRTGFCEPLPCDSRCPDCASGVPCAAAASSPVISERHLTGGEKPGQIAPGVGVSPATGTVPALPPAKATPDAP
jgi:hypothetical protein